MPVQFENMEYIIDTTSGIINARAEKLIAAHIFLDVVSVGATMNIMLAAVKAQGVTTIENAAKEPHIVDLANFLNSMGANIRGAGTDVIKVQGVGALRGGSYAVIPDQIEAGTYMAAVSAAGGSVTIRAKADKTSKKLGFIAQERGREINTLGSKSNEANMQRLVVMMKDELEKIKEQVLNIL